MLKGDLHIHSTYSDGSDSVEEIISMSRIAGLNVIAITDHDTLSHIKAIPKDCDIKIIPGVEISAMDKETGKKAHILGYNIKDVETVESFVSVLPERRHRNSLAQIEVLKSAGYNIGADNIKKSDGKFIYKQNIVDYLFNTGQIEDKFGRFYYSVFKNGGICDSDIEYVDVLEAVRIVKDSGGQAVLAHSGQQQNFYLIDKLVPLGLAGLEYNHPANAALDRDTISKYADKYGLFLTGGTDYHGLNGKVSRMIGDFLTPESGIRALI